MGTNQPQVSICVMFSLDVNTNAVLANISSVLRLEYPSLFKPSVLLGSMPYHMTMIGGVKLWLSEYENVVRELVQTLKPFQEGGTTPRVLKLEPRKRILNTLAITFDLVPGSFVLIGNRQKNEAMVESLAPTFTLDDDRHVTVGAVSGTVSDLDYVYPKFKRLVYENAVALSKATFTPQVWVKHDRVWTQFQI